MSTYEQLPQDLPEPHDDGAADHLPGRAIPALELASTAANWINLTLLGGRTVVYVYPMTGRPGVALPDGWDSIPGARGCTPESCSFRDHYAELQEAGATSVFGVSSQPTDFQQEAAERLHLPFELLSDADFSWADALRLPTFPAGGQRFHRRLTLIVKDAAIEHVFYPVFPPNEHAGEVLDWLQSPP
jgi:peroxiredoxin